MDKDLTYYKYDIENWLDENEQEFGWSKTPEDQIWFMEIAKKRIAMKWGGNIA